MYTYYISQKHRHRCFFIYRFYFVGFGVKNDIGLVSGVLTWKDVDLYIEIISCMCKDTVCKAMFVSLDSIYTHVRGNMYEFYTSIIISHSSCWLMS